ncbi:LEA type 2 family protein [Thermococcus sp.]|uniref:LEA type 2 family protein n=2 Tax=Thermococcus sp. TaxID=35749 RepID=UPI002624E1D9|nr:LEA type 2 family protein [Thermococcus sp.]
MGLIKKAIGLILLLLLLWGGYVIYAALTASPQLSAQWGTANESVTSIVITGKWKKPLLLPVEIQRLSVDFMGMEVARLLEFKYSPTGTSAEGVVAIDNHNLIKALVNYLNSGQRGTAIVSLGGKFLGVIPLSFNRKEEINQDILGQLNFTAESKDLLGGLVKTPALVGTKVEWEGEVENTGFLMAHLRLYNPNDFSIPIGNVSFEVYANGIKIGEGNTEQTIVIPPKGYATLPIETRIDETTIPKAWAIHVKNGEESTLRIDIYMTTTVLGKKVSFKLPSQQETVKTDIMESLNEALEELSKKLSRG